MKQNISIKTKLGQDQKGFTLVEVMLYLAIVGLVILIGMNAVSGRTAQVQYTDAMRSLQSYIDSQYSEFISGVNRLDYGCTYGETSRTPAINDGSGGSSVVSDGSCILLGKLFMFTAADDSASDDPDVDKFVRVYEVVGRNVSDTQFGADGDSCNIEDFRCLDPYVVNFNNPIEHEMLWGLRFTKAVESRYLLFGNNPNPYLYTNNVANDNLRGFGWLKNPISNDPVLIVFGGGPEYDPPFTDNLLLDDPNLFMSYTKRLRNLSEDSSGPRAAMGGEVGSAFCFATPNDQVAMLTVGYDESQESASLIFSEGTDFHDCSL